jgi:hypothetical protein
LSEKGHDYKNMIMTERRNKGGKRDLGMGSDRRKVLAAEACVSAATLKVRTLEGEP